MRIKDRETVSVCILYIECLHLRKTGSNFYIIAVVLPCYTSKYSKFQMSILYIFNKNTAVIAFTLLASIFHFRSGLKNIVHLYDLNFG